MSGVNPEEEQKWIGYLIAMLIFSIVGMLLLYAIERTQQWLPLNPAGFPNVPENLAFNTAASFTTNTNWQNYNGEQTMSYLTQMAGLAFHQFVSAAVGIALVVALICGLARRSAQTLGNFWVDMTRCTLYILTLSNDHQVHRAPARSGSFGKSGFRSRTTPRSPL